MQSEEDPLPNFLELVFKRIKNGNSYFVLDDSQTADVKLVSEFRKKMNLISIALNDVHYVDLRFFFEAMPFSKRNIFTLMSAHCFKMCDDGYNVFFVFMYTCSYVNFVLNFCEEQGWKPLSQLNSMCTQEIFAFRLKEDFEAQGSWAGLESFTLARNLPEFIDFFCACFTDHAKLFTPLTIEDRNYGYGLHNPDICLSSRRVFTVLQRLIVISYHKEFEAHSQYLVQVLSSFKRARTILGHQNGEEGSDPSPVRGRVVISHVQVTLKKRRRRR